MSFENVNVKPEIVSALKKIGIETPTPIQEKSIPLIHSGKDVVGISNTGSGKTAAFGVPMLQHIQKKGKIQALVMAPTRELVVQIAKELEKFSKNLNLFIATVYGGVGFDPQVKNLAKADIVVSTPGRMLDHIEHNTINLTQLTCFVLDEADKMVEMGFIEDITRILDHTPKNKQMLLFGATISDEINRIKADYMTNPETIEADVYVKQELLEQYYYNVKPHEKFSLLCHLLRKEETHGVIIFCSTRATVELISKNLKTQNIKNDMIHGKLTQNRRLKVIEAFNKEKVNVLVASSVAARGLHIDHVSHVFNYDLSRDPEEYIHRIGRTARAGQRGKAITLLSQKDYPSFDEINSRFNVSIEKLPPEQFERLRFDMKSGQQRRGHFNNRSFGGPRGHGRSHHSQRQGSSHGRSRFGGQKKSSFGFNDIHTR